MEGFTNKIEQLIKAGWNISAPEAYNAWSSRVAAFLTTAINENAAKVFTDLGGYSWQWELSRERQIGHLEGLALKVEARGLAQTTTDKPALPPAIPKSTKKVFVVHGHDKESKEQVARFLERLGLEPVVLHEQPNSGRTIIEKFEVYADVSFAVILLTPDDIAAEASAPNVTRPRARQNVILELGYFMGKLSRQQVCALYKQGVEIPSDYQGVLYVEMDAAGGWRTKLAQELVHVGFNIDLQALLRS